MRSVGRCPEFPDMQDSWDSKKGKTRAMNLWQDRVNKFSLELKKEGLDAAVLLNAANIRYFTDLRMNPAAESIAVITSAGEIIYFVAPLDFKRAKLNCWIPEIIPFPESVSNHLLPLTDFFKKRAIKRLGFESDSISHKYYCFLRDDLSAELVSCSEGLVVLRSIKTPEEIDSIRKAAAIVDTAMQECMMMLSEGITESKLTGYARYVFEREGAEGAAFDPFVASGENSWLPQRFPSNKRIMPGEMILFDMGAVYNGYCSDLTRTMAIGGLNPEQMDIFEVAYAAQQKAIRAVKPGVSVGYIDEVARDHIAQAGYGDCFPHITGHGVGLSIHEYPIVSGGNDHILCENMVITVEPGIYLENVGAARVEDMVLVTNDSCEVLTKTKRELV